MNIRITAALRTAVTVATILMSALAVNLSVSYFGLQTMLTVGLVCLVAFMIHMVYTMNLKELETKKTLDKMLKEKVDQ
jgi:fatty acid desaturase